MRGKLLELKHGRPMLVQRENMYLEQTENKDVQLD
jgi:hypothetical protein